jgi:hypothetical protein
MDVAKAIADAVLYEGYLLYPYRASAKKNQVRWQWGVLVPSSYATAGHGEHDRSRTEVLVEPDWDVTDPVLHVRLRFLQLQSRAVQDVEGRRVDTLVVDGVEMGNWDEAIEREHDAVVQLSELAGEAPYIIDVQVPGGELVEEVHGPVSGRVVRTRWPLHTQLRLQTRELPGPYGVLQLTMEVVNVSGWTEQDATRDYALRHSLVAAHTVLALTGARFLSMLEPPEWATGYVEHCRNEGTFPVLVGEPGSGDVLLASPIILYDYPQIAPESPGELFDGTEIDEILTLRTLALTDEEKREARATDPKARALMDRIDGMPSEVLERLHGAVRYLEDMAGPRASAQASSESPSSGIDTRREPDAIETITTPGTPWWDPGADSSVNPETDSVIVQGIPVSKGSRVVLRPGMKRADAQDMFLVGRSATVQAVFLDVDGDNHVAVTLDDDPGSELAAAHGRYRYFAPDELEPAP